MKFIRQLSIILTISFIAELMEYLIPIPVAASMYGLILMLIGLVTKIIPLNKVQGAADFLIDILPILFVPPTVGIMASAEELKEMLVPLCVICMVSTILIMAVTGRVAQHVIRGNKAGEKVEGSTGGNTGGNTEGKAEEKTEAKKEGSQV
ncbi:MAG: CidA/LrgA family protein [Lachnospiraceae bacterium]|nr:CidA/LrgA family protein [Lachnospiraceae bacterium]